MYVYFYFGEDSRGQDNLLLYIGTSRDVVARFNQHKYENADWMSKVKAVAVRGLYEGDDAIKFERYYIGKYKPLFNEKSINCTFEECLIDYTTELRFPTVDAFIEHFNANPDMLHRATLYLRKIDLEAMNILKYYTGEPISEIAPKALGIGLKAIVEESGYDDVYEQAYDRVVHLDVWKKRGQKKTRNTTYGRSI